MRKQMLNIQFEKSPKGLLILSNFSSLPHFSFSFSLYAVLMKDVREMFNLRFSLNFYMFHGGTNFGFMGGAASLQNYLPMVTSYGKYFSPKLPPT